MGRFKQEDGIGVHDDPVDGETHDGDETKQKEDAIQSEDGSGHIPETLFPLLCRVGSHRPALKIQALLQFLKESNERKSGNKNWNEVKERIGHHKIYGKNVRFSHSLHVRTAFVVGYRRRHRKR